MSEIGRELKPSELQEGIVVAVQPPGREECFTVWVKFVSKSIVVFYSGVHRTNVINLVQPVPDGVGLFDDRGGRVHVFEWLGDA